MMDKSIHSKFLIWKSVIIIHVNYMRYRCLSETRSYLIVCRSVVSLILCDGRLPYNKEEKKTKEFRIAVCTYDLWIIQGCASLFVFWERDRAYVTNTRHEISLLDSWTVRVSQVVIKCARQIKYDSDSGCTIFPF